MTTLHFKVSLLSDVIINQRAATEGNQKTLDFIPGGAFLGIAAGKLYSKVDPEESMTLFHSGKVRFGDAHPLVDNNRALKVPASWYKRKDDKDDRKLFVHHGIPEDGLRDNGNPVQVKQYRGDFMVLTEEKTVSKIEINKHFTIKSAYDSDKRRSEDAKMYGYESLREGSQWGFSIEVENTVSSELCKKLQNAIPGRNHIGRSSTAQYGLVEIEIVKDLSSGFGIWENPKTRNNEEEVVFVYAESRLIFFDGNGQPTFTPEPEQLGFYGGKMCWEMCQVRTFQYAPYNNKRQTRDADRMGVEKGSVFCIIGVSSSEKGIWVGSYQNEGFGKALINPEFLEYQDYEAGKAIHSFATVKAKSDIIEMKTPSIEIENTHILNYLNRQKAMKENQEFVYEKVNQFVVANSDKFRDGVFASQWGTIRSLAMQFRKPNELEKELYLNDKSYLKHGVAAEKWRERDRIKLLEKFIADFAKRENRIPDAIINLSAEMAKKCRRK